MSRLLRPLFAIGFVVLATVAPALAAGAQTGSPTLDVTPDRALEDGDTLQVSGSGFPPSTPLFILLCNGDERLGDEVARCSLIGTGADGYVTDAVGRLAPQLVDVPVGQVGASEQAVCPPSRAQLARGVTCGIEVAGQDLAVVAGESVEYQGQASPEAAALAFTGLRGEQFIAPAMILILGGALLQFAAMLLRRRSPVTLVRASR